MRWTSSLLLAAVLALPTGAAAAQNAGRWSMRAPLPEPRAELATVAYDGQLYTFGGAVNGADATAIAEAYDPAHNVWRKLAPMPQALTHVGVAALNGKIYILGGFLRDVHVGAQASAFGYNPGSDHWERLPRLPNPRGSIGVVALEGKIHAIGGRGPDQVTVAEHDVYDPVAGRWSQAAPLPVARDHLLALAVNGKIHVIGGRTSSYTDVTAYHDVYDPQTDRWSEAAPLSTARSAMAGSVYEGLIVVFGGECKRGHTFDANEAYDLAGGHWLALAPVQGRHGFGAGTLGSAMYFAGGAKGCGGTRFTDELLMFTLP